MGIKRISLLTGLTWISILITFPQNIDTTNSKVHFTIKHMKWKAAEGTLSGMQGEVNFNENDPENSFFSVCIDASTVNTENEKRDNKLRSEDFFWVDTFPSICFESTEIKQTAHGFVTRGNLTMLGITRETEINFSFSNRQFSGNLEINRFDYTLGEGTGSFKLGEEVAIKIECFLK